MKKLKIKSLVSAYFLIATAAPLSGAEIFDDRSGRGDTGVIAAQISAQWRKLNDAGCPLSIAYQARRFILKSDWQKEVLQAALEHRPPNPTYVYSPAPETWLKWEATTRAVESQAQSGLALTKTQILDWNKASLVGNPAGNPIAGEVKKYFNYGSNVKARDAQSTQEIVNIRDFDLSFLAQTPGLTVEKKDRRFVGKDLLQWQDLVCQESLPPRLDLLKDSPNACRRLYRDMRILAAKGDEFMRKSAELFAQGAYRYEEGAWYWFACWPRLNVSVLPEKRCGFLTYAGPADTDRALDLVIKGVNQFLSDGYSRTPAEIFRFALQSQRGLVAIHPVGKGNGRISRWLMDYVTTRLGLPPLIIEDHNRDLSLSEDQYLSSTLSETSALLAEELAKCKP